MGYYKAVLTTWLLAFTLAVLLAYDIGRGLL